MKKLSSLVILFFLFLSFSGVHASGDETLLQSNNRYLYNRKKLGQEISKIRLKIKKTSVKYDRTTILSMNKIKTRYYRRSFQIEQTKPFAGESYKKFLQRKKSLFVDMNNKREKALYIQQQKSNQKKKNAVAIIKKRLELLLEKTRFLVFYEKVNLRNSTYDKNNRSFYFNISCNIDGFNYTNRIVYKVDIADSSKLKQRVASINKKIKSHSYRPELVYKIDLANNKKGFHSIIIRDMEKKTNEQNATGEALIGQGSTLYNNGDSYVGRWKDGNRYGQGVYIWENGNKYSGEWLAGDRNGKGTMVWANDSKYTGDWKNDKADGSGIYYSKKGYIYKGKLEKDKRKGKGTKIYANGDRYIGNWENNLRHGNGVYVWKNGNKYIGRWNNDKIFGAGKNIATKSYRIAAQAAYQKTEQIRGKIKKRIAAWNKYLEKYSFGNWGTKGKNKLASLKSQLYLQNSLARMKTTNDKKSLKKPKNNRKLFSIYLRGGGTLIPNFYDDLNEEAQSKVKNMQGRFMYNFTRVFSTGAFFGFNIYSMEGLEMDDISGGGVLQLNLGKKVFKTIIYSGFGYKMGSDYESPFFISGLGFEYLLTDWLGLGVGAEYMRCTKEELDPLNYINFSFGLSFHLGNSAGDEIAPAKKTNDKKSTNKAKENRKLFSFYLHGGLSPASGYDSDYDGVNTYFYNNNSVKTIDGRLMYNFNRIFSAGVFFGYNSYTFDDYGDNMLADISVGGVLQLTFGKSAFKTIIYSGLGYEKGGEYESVIITLGGGFEYMITDWLGLGVGLKYFYNYEGDVAIYEMPDMKIFDIEYVSFTFGLSFHFGNSL